MNSLDIETAIRMLIEGRTYREVGVHFGLSRQRIQQIVRPDKETRDHLLEQCRGKCARCGSTPVHPHFHHDWLTIPVRITVLCAGCHRKSAIRRVPTKQKVNNAIGHKKTLPVFMRPLREITVTTRDVMSLEEASAALHWPELTISHLAETGGCYHVRFGGITYVLTSEVERLKKESQTAGKQEAPAPRTDAGA